MNYKDKQKATREALKPKLISSEQPNHMIQIMNKMVFVNRKTARQRTIDRTMTKRGYRYGKKINA